MTWHRDQAAIRIRNRYAALHVARLDPGESVTIPDAPYAHVYLARGRMDLEAEGALDAGGAARLTAAGERRFGVPVPVFEQARALREIGAGVTITPNAMNVLDFLGIGPALAEQAGETNGTTFEAPAFVGADGGASRRRFLVTRRRGEIAPTAFSWPLATRI